MKKLFCCYMVIVLLVSCNISQAAVVSSATVYITRTGERYHRFECSYISEKTSISLYKATQAGYTPCKHCNPDILQSEYEPHPAIQKERDAKAQAEAERNNQSTKSNANDKLSTSNGTQTNVQTAKNNMIFYVVIAVLLILCLIASKRSRDARRKLYGIQSQLCSLDESTQREIENYQKLLAIETSLRKDKDRQSCRNALFLKYNGKSLSEVCSAPPDMTVGADHLPRFVTKSRKFPKLFINSTHTIYHDKKCASAHYGTEIKPWQLSGARPCSICKPPLYNFEWLKAYNQIRKTLDEYDLTLSIVDNVLNVKEKTDCANNMPPP